MNMLAQGAMPFVGTPFIDPAGNDLNLMFTAEPGTGATDDPSANNDAFAMDDPYPTPPPNAERMADWRWWKPWNVDETTERQIADVFEANAPIEERLWDGFRVLSHRRYADVVQRSGVEKTLGAIDGARDDFTFLGHPMMNAEDLAAASESYFALFPPSIREQVPGRTIADFNRAFKLHIAEMKARNEAVDPLAMWKTMREFDKIQRSQHHSGLLYSDGTIWLAPLLRDVPNGIGLINVLTHEAAGHDAAARGANGAIASALLYLGSNTALNIVRALLDPTTPLSNRLLTYLVEGEAIGAEWEYIHRIPADMRTQLMEAIADSMEEKERTLLNEKGWIPRRALDALGLEKGSAERVRALYRAGAYQHLALADRKKGAYIRRVRKMGGYSPLRMLWEPTRRDWYVSSMEGLTKSFWQKRIGYAAKLSAFAYLLSQVVG